ncbi:MAG TPA: hypothetical protein VM695_01195 [Phycisphaerae bacterium]|nr:hypothetical protein [Phycisphaerae bacterium]
MRRISMAVVLGCAVPAASAPVDKPSFAQTPKVRRVAGAWEVSFVVAAPTDVEVAVLDAAGGVVRHLAAGMLGGRSTPPRPLRAGLAQTLSWDGRDDFGTPAAGGPFRVRVRAGMGAKLGRLIGGSPCAGQATGMPYSGSVPGVAVDGEGNVFVKLMSDVGSHGNTGLWPWQLRRLDRDGNYVRTLLPYPPSTDPARASGYELIDAPGGHFTPVNQNSLYPVFAVFGPAIHHTLTAAGEVVFIHSRERKLYFFKADGSNALRTVSIWPEKLKMPAPSWLDFTLAFSPDGRYAYYANVAGTQYDGRHPREIDANWPNGRVYRQDLSRAGAAAEPFFDLDLPDWDKRKYWMPSAWDKRTAAVGLDTDAEGNLYVCDQVNQQVVTVSPTGKRLAAVKLPWPDRVRVHPRTGDLYVVSREVSRGYRAPDKLLKVTGRGAEAKVAATLAMERRGNVEFALDPRGPDPLLWVLAPSERSGGQALLRVADRGGELAVTADAFGRDPNAMSFAGNLAADRDAGAVYVTDTRGKVWRYDGQTGEGGLLKLSSTLLAAGPDGRIVCVSGWRSPLASYTRDLKPSAVTPDGRHTFGEFAGRAGRGCSVGGLCVDHRGWTWTLQEGGGGMFVCAFDRDGSPVEGRFSQQVKDGEASVPAVVAGFDIHASCVRVDRQGNVYVGWLGRPKGHAPPGGYENDRAWREAVGSVLKFGPGGGRRLKLRADERPPEGAVMGFEGVRAVYPGLAPFSQWRCAGSCVCTKPRFDVDEFGRLAIPNAITFSVRILDNAGNELLRFGHYGNYDARGPGSAEPRPAVPLGWPTNVAVIGDRVFVADVLNHRIARVDLTFAAEASCPVP